MQSFEVRRPFFSSPVGVIVRVERCRNIVSCWLWFDTEYCLDGGPDGGTVVLNAALGG